MIWLKSCNQPEPTWTMTHWTKTHIASCQVTSQIEVRCCGSAVVVLTGNNLGGVFHFHIPYKLKNSKRICTDMHLVLVCIEDGCDLNHCCLSVSADNSWSLRTCLATNVLSNFLVVLVIFSRIFIYSINSVDELSLWYLDFIVKISKITEK